MTEIDLIRVILLFGVFRMIWKCFHKFPQEYFHETSYFLLYTFSYSCFIISFLVLLFITKISVILHIVEFNMFLGICLMLGVSGIGILEAIKKGDADEAERLANLHIMHVMENLHIEIED